MPILSFASACNGDHPLGFCKALAENQSQPRTGRGVQSNEQNQITHDETQRKGDRATLVFHGLLLLIHDLVAFWSGHRWWDNQHNDSWAKAGSLSDKHAGQAIVLAKGRV